MALVPRRVAKSEPQHQERLKVLQMRHNRVTARLAATAQTGWPNLDLELLRLLKKESV